MVDEFVLVDEMRLRRNNVNVILLFFNFFIYYSKSFKIQVYNKTVNVNNEILYLFPLIVILPIIYCCHTLVRNKQIFFSFCQSEQLLKTSSHAV